MAFTAVEHAVLCAARWCVTRRTLLIVAATALVTWWLLRRGACSPSSARPTAPDAPGPTTLYDPVRLQSAFRLFAEAGTGAHSTNQDVRMRTETLCRTLLEAMLGFPLPKVRPKWLVNPTTRRSLELDMYNAERRLAFEVDGAQHEVYTPHFHGNKDHFQYRKLLDKLKNELCHENGVRLIRLPYHEMSANNELKTARYLERMLHAHGIPFSPLPIPVDKKSE